MSNSYMHVHTIFLLIHLHELFTWRCPTSLHKTSRYACVKGLETKNQVESLRTVKMETAAVDHTFKQLDLNIFIINNLKKYSLSINQQT